MKTTKSEWINEYGLTDCGCGVVYVEARRALDYCPLHANAAALLKALEDAVESLERLPNVEGAYRQTCISQARAVIREVSG